MVVERLHNVPACHQTDGWTDAKASVGWVGAGGVLCMRASVGVAGHGRLGRWHRKSKLTSVDSQERRVNGARKSVPSPDDEAKHHEDQDDGPSHSHHCNYDDRVLLAGDNGSC